MRRTLFYIFFLSFLCVNAMAQDSFYYYDGKKVPLKRVDGKVVVRTALGERTAALQNGLRVINNISDMRQRLVVCEYDAGDVSAKCSVLAKISSEKSSFLPCYNDDQGLELWLTGYVLVKLKSANDVSTLYAEARKYGLEVLEQDKFMPLWYLLQGGDDITMPLTDIANRMYESGLFASVSPDFACNGSEISYDPYVHSQWGLYNSTNEGYDINVSQAWNYATGRGVKIAIVDNGVDIWHKDLAANADSALSYDAVTNTSPNKIYGVRTNLDIGSLSHGTHCAGIAAAVRNNGICGSGVAPDAKLMTISSHYTSDELAKAINWAWSEGADIISCSWTCAAAVKIKEAFDNAIIYGRDGKGCIIVKSAGNQGKTSGKITWPGTYRKEIITVASMDNDGFLSETSSFGDSLFVMAPGTFIYSTLVGDGFGIMNGTSMAAPHVAGVAALILERNNDLTADQVRMMIGRTAKRVGKDFRNNGEFFKYNINKEFGAWNMFAGYGLVDAYNAVKTTPRK